MRRSPKEEAADERRDDKADVDHYEQLRRRALDGEASGWRLGLGVLQHRGVAAWLRAWRTTVPKTNPRPKAPTADVPGGEELVGVLAAMALACIGR